MIARTTGIARERNAACTFRRACVSRTGAQAHARPYAGDALWARRYHRRGHLCAGWRSRLSRRHVRAARVCRRRHSYGTVGSIVRRACGPAAGGGGEAAYVRQAFGSRQLATATGLLVIGIALISAAAISIGSAGYLGAFIDLPRPALVAVVVLAMGAVAAWGVKESVSFAALMTLVEIGGLVLLVMAGLATRGPELAGRLPEMVPPPDPAVLSGIMGTALLAVFAFIGFEGLANIAEEVHEPHRTLPRAIFLTLGIATALYVMVVWVALVSVPGKSSRNRARRSRSFSSA